MKQRQREIKNKIAHLIFKIIAKLATKHFFIRIQQQTKNEKIVFFYLKETQIET